MPVYMKIEGVDGYAYARGASRLGRYDRWIEISSMVKRGRGVEGGKLIVSKPINESSAKLSSLELSRRTGLKVTIEIVDQNIAAKRITLHDAAVEDVHMMQGAGQMERVTLSFQKAGV